MLRSGFLGLKKKNNNKTDVKNKSRTVTKHWANEECTQHEHT